MDPELLALARAGKPEGAAAAAAAAQEAARVERERLARALRGEPQSWEELSDGEQDGEWGWGGRGGGGWSGVGWLGSRGPQGGVPAA